MKSSRCHPPNGSWPCQFNTIGIDTTVTDYLPRLISFEIETGPTCTSVVAGTVVCRQCSDVNSDIQSIGRSTR